jgi:hypothetical protein
MPFDFSERNKILIKNRNQRLFKEKVFNAPPAVIKEGSHGIVLTGGVGDVLALESFFNDSEREKLETVYYATRKSALIIEIFRRFYNFPNLKNHYVSFDDFSKFWCFYTKDELIVHLKTKRMNLPPGIIQSEDWSIMPKFARIHSGYMKYTGSSVLKNNLCNVHDFGLPEKYFVICPYSSDKRVSSRDFDDNDWKNTKTMLYRKNLRGVVLNLGPDIVPSDDCLIDLSNQTSIIEALEILKKASGYIGVNSVLSVIAAKLFVYPDLIIKSTDDHCFKHKDIYYAPHKSFEFIKNSIELL